MSRKFKLEAKVDEEVKFLVYIHDDNRFEFDVLPICSDKSELSYMLEILQQVTQYISQYNISSLEVRQI